MRLLHSLLLSEVEQMHFMVWS